MFSKPKAPLHAAARAVAILCYLSWGQRAQAQASDYETTTTAAVEEYAQGRGEEALALFTKAHALQPSARTLRGMGMASFETGRYADAFRYLSAALADPRKPLTATQRRDAEKLIERASAFVIRLQLEVTPEDAEVALDGRVLESRRAGEPILLDAGSHQLVASAAGYEPAVRSVQWPAGSTARLKLQLSPKAVPKEGSTDDLGTTTERTLGAPQQPAALAPAVAPTRFGTLKYVMLGASVGALASTIVAVALREDRARALKKSCLDYPPGGESEKLCPGYRDSGLTWRRVAIGTAALTGALALSTVLLFSFDRPAESRLSRALTACDVSLAGSSSLLCRVHF